MAQLRQNPTASSTAETQPDFARRMQNMIQESSTCLGVALGSELGLFDLMVSLDKPLTSQDLADASGYKERYVREWLGLMTVSHVVDYIPASQTYWLPQHRRKAVSGSGAQSNMAYLAEVITMMSGNYDAVKSCFPQDGPTGIANEKNARIATAISRYSEDCYTWHFLKEKLQKVDHLLENLEKGIVMCEIGCSIGVVLTRIAERFPKSTFYGCDTDQSAIARARQKAKEKDLHNIIFLVQDGCDMPAEFNEKFDFIFMQDIIHHLPYASKALRDIYKVLKPGSYLLALEAIAEPDLAHSGKHPEECMFYGCSLFYCLPESYSAEDSEALGAVVGYQKLEQILKQAGFSVQTHLGYWALFVCHKTRGMSTGKEIRGHDGNEITNAL